MRSTFEADPLDSTVIVVEDESWMVENIGAELTQIGNVAWVAQTDVEALRTYLRQHEVDVATVDWELFTYGMGRQVLQTLLDVQPAAARIVFSKHLDAQREAHDAGADAFVRKPDPWQTDGMREYRMTMVEAILLGQDRRICEVLAAAGVRDLPWLARLASLTEEAETNLFEIARRHVMKSPTEVGKPNVLRRLLRRRGWYRSFDAAEYSGLPWHVKLHRLAEYVDLRPEDVARVLGAEVADVRALLDGSGGASGDALTLGRHGDTLLSVLGFVLAASRYDPEMMPEYWSHPSLYDASSSPPPWKGSSLRDHLLETGPQGLERCRDWIRSH